MVVINIFLSVLLLMSNNQNNKDFNSKMIDNTTFMCVTLSENSLSDVKNKWGNIDSFKVEDCHHCKGVCYTYASDCDTITVLFLKNPIADLLGFKLFYASPSDKFDDICFDLRTSEVSLVTGGGLYLGMSKNKLIEIMGDPQFQKENEYIYQLSKKIKLSNRNGLYDDVITIKTKINNNMIIMLEVMRTITY